mmetsp:Transcript_3237/g.5181  ORF Transcript_3237/g.5181 Transcript_3237/m.5181 type:complete len:207 (+) Transcript_3237:440-1060(+)
MTHAMRALFNNATLHCNTTKRMLSRTRRNSNARGRRRRAACSCLPQSWPTTQRANIKRNPTHRQMSCQQTRLPTTRFRSSYTSSFSLNCSKIDNWWRRMMRVCPSRALHRTSNSCCLPFTSTCSRCRSPCCPTPTTLLLTTSNMVLSPRVSHMLTHKARVMSRSEHIVMKKRLLEQFERHDSCTLPTNIARRPSVWRVSTTKVDAS